MVPAPAVTASTAGAGTASDEAAANEATSDAATNDDEPDHAADARLDVLRAVERGEIDIEEATRRLASLDEPTDG